MIRRLLGYSAMLLGLVGATSSGCHPSLPPHGAAPLTPPVPSAPPTDASASAAPVVEAPPDPNVFDPARISLVLDDARLAAVKAAVEHEAYPRAAEELTTALAVAGTDARHPQATPEERRDWLYQLGRLRALGGDPTGAAKAFHDAAATPATPWPLADYARLQAAQALAAGGKYDAALAEAGAIGADLPIAPAVDLVLADALHGKGDIDGAAAHWRAYLGKDKHPPSWVQVTLAFANALLTKPSAAHAEEAIRLARGVLYGSPGGAGAGEAKDIEKKALATLPHRKRGAFEHPSAEELVARAKLLASAGQSREAVLVTDKLVKLPRFKAASEPACELWLARADALGKMRKKPEAAVAFEGAIDHCEGQPKRAEALYLGGRALASAGRNVDAGARFAQLEKELPQHRLADDARLRGARAARDAGDDARFEKLLAAIADDYPQGDVATDGLFELALAHIARGDWAGAVPALEKALARSPHERAYFAAGRLPYFLARAHIAAGQADQGAAELAAVIHDYPLSYYMALAHARLAERDPSAAGRAVGEGFGREPAGAFTVLRGAWTDDPAFLRALELVRQGDAKLARGELDKLGVGARTAPLDLLWASAFLLARAGAITASHGLLRSAMNSNARPDAAEGSAGAKPRVELVDWLDHYPAGRWRAAWEVAYPRPWGELVAAESKRSGISEAFAYAIMREESAFEPRVVSGAKAFGLMQLIVPTATKMAKPLGLVADEESLKRPEVNIAVGCRYLSILRGQFADNPLMAIPGYNAGGGAPRKWIDARPGEDFDVWVERIPYEETRQYTKRVITSLLAYEELYARDRPSEALRTPVAASPSAKAAIPPAGSGGAATP